MNNIGAAEVVRFGTVAEGMVITNRYRQKNALPESRLYRVIDIVDTEEGLYIVLEKVRRQKAIRYGQGVVPWWEPVPNSHRLTLKWITMRNWRPV